MARFTEEQFNQMCRPASTTEETKLQNAQAMVKRALAASTILQSSKYEIFGQGSYANNTNIRLNSDIDINVCYDAGFYYQLPEGKTGNDYGITPHPYSFETYKNDIEKMLVAFYGRSEVIRKNKCITINGNTNRIQVDVVPTWKHRRYNNVQNNYVEGVVLWTDNSDEKIVNYPKQHLSNGVEKNNQSLRRFKRLARIFKNVRIRMKDDGYYSNDNITSFLLECLAFNVPTSTYTKNLDSCTWNNILKDAIYYLWDATKEESIVCNEWGEVSELLYLLRGHKWSREDVHEYMHRMWNYLQLS